MGRFIAGLLAGALIATGTMVPHKAGAQGLQKYLEEQQAWQKVEKSKDPGDLRKFLDKYPKGLHAKDAQKQLDGLEKAQAARQSGSSPASPAAPAAAPTAATGSAPATTAPVATAPVATPPAAKAPSGPARTPEGFKARADGMYESSNGQIMTLEQAQYVEQSRAYDKIRNSQNPEDFQKFLAKYPNSELGSSAQGRLDYLESMQWGRVTRSNPSNPADYKAFLVQFPNGKYAPSARHHLDLVANHPLANMLKWQQAAPGKGGWTSDTTLPSPSGYQLFSAASFPGGGAVVAFSYGKQKEKVYESYAVVQRVDAAGKIVFSAEFKDQFVNDLLPLPDGGALVAGSVRKPGERMVDGHLMALTGTGAVAWQMTVPSPIGLVLTRLAATEGGFVALGEDLTAADGKISHMPRPLIMKVDAKGAQVWKQTYETKQPPTPVDPFIGTTFGKWRMAPRPDGSFLVTGNQLLDFKAEEYTPFVGLIDKTGRQVKALEVAKSDAAILEFLPTADGGGWIIGEGRDPKTLETTQATARVDAGLKAKDIHFPSFPAAKKLSQGLATSSPDGGLLQVIDVTRGEGEKRTVDRAIVSYDATGKVRWTHELPARMGSLSTKLTAMPDNGAVLLVSDTWPEAVERPSATPFVLIRLSSAGKVLWQQTAQTMLQEGSVSALLTHPGGAISLVGSSKYVGGDGSRHFWVQRFTPEGKL